MQGLSDMRVIRPLLERHGFRFSKSLGQNFIIDASVCPRMAELSGAADADGALEIGPGVGVLTYALAQQRFFKNIARQAAFKSKCPQAVL